MENVEIKLYIALLLTLNHELMNTGGRIELTLNYAAKRLEAPLRSEAVGAVDGYLPDTWVASYVGMSLTLARIGPVRIVDKDGHDCSMDTTKMVARQKLVADFYRAYFFVMIHLKYMDLSSGCQVRMQKVLGGQSRPGMLSHVVHELLSPCDPQISTYRHIDRINDEFRAHCEKCSTRCVPVTRVDVVLDDKLLEDRLPGVVELWEHVKRFHEVEAAAGDSTTSSLAMEGLKLQVRIAKFLRSLERPYLATAQRCASVDSLVTDLEIFGRRRFFSEGNEAEFNSLLLAAQAAIPK
jgi:hypothetical protein